jgi:uncharacterized membrane protein (DUF373 family)
MNGKSKRHTERTEPVERLRIFSSRPEAPRIFRALISFNRLKDLFLNLPVFLVTLVLGMGLFRLFSEVGAVMAASNLKEAFELTVTGLLIFFVILGLFQSLVAYFREHRLNLTFIMDAALVFILRY